MTKPKKTPMQLAEEHTDWFLAMVRPLLIAWMIHGYKHGRKDKR